MIPHDHTYFSDPHIGDPVCWLEGGDDPMLLGEQLDFKIRRQWRERMQLLFGTFVLTVIVATTTSATKNPEYALHQASLIGITEKEKFENPKPAFPSPELSAHAYLVRLVGTSDPLMHQREWKPLPPASLTKLLTAVVARERLTQDTKVVISKEAKSVGEKMSGAKIGDTFLRDDAIRFALIESANDAAYALAETIERIKTGNNPEKNLANFVRLTKETAEKIGMPHTRFINPTGLDQDGHETSAEDLGKLIEYIWNNHPDIWQTTALAEANIASLEGGEYRIESTNELLREFPALKGGKTGFTDMAKGALILLYPVRPSYTALIVILGSENRFEDGRKIIHWLDEAF